MPPGNSLRRRPLLLAFALCSIVAAAVFVALLKPSVDAGCVSGRWKDGCRAVVYEVSQPNRSAMRCVLRDRSTGVSFTSGGLRLNADLYAPKATGKSPGVVLLHGSSSYGRRLPLIRVLGAELARRGYLVVAPDLRGFGDSEDPADLDQAASFDFSQDVLSSVAFLRANSRVDASRIYVVGHSFGAGAALDALVGDEDIRAAVLFGPPRRIRERVLSTNAPDSAYFEDRARLDLGLGRRPGSHAWRTVTSRLDIETYSEREGLETPLLLIDSEHEDAEDLAFLRRMVEQMDPTPSYWTVPGTNHYLGTGLIAGKPCYNRDIVVHFVEHVSKWLSQAPA